MLFQQPLDPNVFIPQRRPGSNEIRHQTYAGRILADLHGDAPRAQELFFAGKTARVTSVHEDVDGNQHVGVVVDDDPAADLHEWYGRYLYFAPDEVEPLETITTERN